MAVSSCHNNIIMRPLNINIKPPGRQVVGQFKIVILNKHHNKIQDTKITNIAKVSSLKMTDLLSQTTPVLQAVASRTSTPTQTRSIRSITWFWADNTLVGQMGFLNSNISNRIKTITFHQQKASKWPKNNQSPCTTQLKDSLSLAFNHSCKAKIILVSVHLK